MPARWAKRSSSYVVPVTGDAPREPVDLVAILLDLTYYDCPELVSAALGLLVRQYEQRKVLEASARRVQLLVIERMCRMHATFDALLSPLERLSERRYLYGDEVYQAALLMGELTMHCYREGDAEEAHEVEVERAPPPLRRGRTSASLAKFMADAADHTRGVFLLLVGRASGTKGSPELVDVRLEPFAPADLATATLHILGHAYRVVSRGVDDGAITLEAPLEVVRGQEAHQWPAAMVDGTPGEVWLFLESTYPPGLPNTDMQLLLYNLDCHKIAARFLDLPVRTAAVPEESGVRQVLLSVYRLLKALCSGFKVTQLALAAEIPRIVAHVEHRLVAHDITPTGCLSAIIRDNSTVCLSISDDLIRRFVKLAAAEHAPRYLRFLRTVTGPGACPVERAQFFVIQSLSENVGAQLLFNSTEGMAHRAKLLADGDLAEHPRGEMAYHIELIGLIARCTEGLVPGPEAIARRMLTMPDLLAHLTRDELPVALRTNYLLVLNEAYLVTKRPMDKSPVEPAHAVPTDPRAFRAQIPVHSLHGAPLKPLHTVCAAAGRPSSRRCSR